MDVAGDGIGVDRQPSLRCVVSRAQEQLLLNGRRTSDEILLLATDSLNAKDVFDSEKTQYILEDFWDVECGAVRLDDSHEVGAVRSREGHF